MSYPVPELFHSIELEIKKSRFIGWAEKVESRDQAMAFLDRARKDYPDARHHCWAYQLGNPNSPSNAAMSDDGEPSGTAGKPILNVLQHKGIGDVMIIVIRYFGGIKLGAGGLVRAYSGAAEKVMSELSIEERIAMFSKKLDVDFSQEQIVRHWLNQHQGNVLQVNYGNCAQMHIELPLEHQEALQIFTANQKI